jgi:hypothetical protein
VEKDGEDVGLRLAGIHDRVPPRRLQRDLRHGIERAEYPLSDTVDFLEDKVVL